MYYRCPFSCLRKTTIGNGLYILDYKKGDVNGDKIKDKVFLVGSKPYGESSPFRDNISLVVQDGATNKYTKIALKEDSGYNPTIFLGDFTNDKIKDILVSIDSGGSGGFGFYYIYSMVANKSKEIFNFEKFNEEYKYDVNYMDNYKVEVISKKLNKKYIIDIRYKGKEYLSEIYDENGKLKKPIQGAVTGLGSLYPIDFQRNGSYQLYIFQRIIGMYNADGLGYVNDTLGWKNNGFVNLSETVAIFGEELKLKKEKIKM